MTRSAFPPSKRLDRRMFCAATLALPLSAVHSSRASTAQDYPPPFFTERSQFVEIKPKVCVSTFSLHGASGGVRSIGSFAGKALLLNLWASWCAPCRRELPTLERVHMQSAAEPFEVAAVSIDRDPARATAFLREMGLKRLKTYVDPERALSQRPDQPDPSPFKLYALPMSYVIDRRGQLVGYVAGEADWESEAGLNLLRYFGRA